MCFVITVKNKYPGPACPIHIGETKNCLKLKRWKIDCLNKNPPENFLHGTLPCLKFHTCYCNSSWSISCSKWWAAFVIPFILLQSQTSWHSKAESSWTDTVLWVTAVWLFGSDPQSTQPARNFCSCNTFAQREFFSAKVGSKTTLSMLTLWLQGKKKKKALWKGFTPIVLLSVLWNYKKWQTSP